MQLVLEIRCHLDHPVGILTGTREDHACAAVSGDADAGHRSNHVPDATFALQSIHDLGDHGRAVALVERRAVTAHDDLDSVAGIATEVTLGEVTHSH